MRTEKLARIVAIAILTTSLSMPTALAAPGGGSSGNSMSNPEPKKSPKALKCKRGETVKRVTRKGKRVKICVKLKADVSPDAELYQNARLLADDGEYEWALDHLRLITNQNDAEVLNYTGYSNRKAGRLETGISYYHKALAVNPDYVQAREYLGEAYLLAGRMDLAKAQLREIRLRCGTSCETYRALENAIADPAN